MKHIMMKPAVMSSLTICALLLMPSVAHAQFATDSTAPITGSADSVENYKDVTKFSGQVDIRQGDVRILADTVEVFSAAASNSGEQALGDIERMEAVGNFFYITPDQEVKGDKGVYERRKDNFIITGNVILLQGDDNVVTGERLVYNLSDNKAVVTGSCKGRRCGSKGRVNILIKNTSRNNR